MNSKYRYLLPCIAVVILIYIWLISSGTWTTWTSPTRYYANLARGFQKGHLYIPSKPPKELLTLSNPYDPNERSRVGADTPIDISYYNGKYYLYWGPVPALLLIAISPFYTGRIGDLQITFAFVVGIFLMQSIFINWIWNRYFYKLPEWTLLISVVLVGLSGPVPFMLNNYFSARIYEAAITGGQFFLLGGFVMAFFAIRKLSWAWLAIFAGILWAMAIGTRLLLVAPIGIMALMLTYGIVTMPGNKWGGVYLTCLAFPLLIGIACLGWYNWARFGSVTESGLYYQMNTGIVHKYYNDIFDVSYMPQNLYNYLLTPFKIQSQIPFLQLRYGTKKPIFSFYSFPIAYGSQFFTGLLYQVPFVLFAPILVTMLFKKKKFTFPKSTDEEYILHWSILTLGGSFLASFSILMMYFWVGMRFLEDFMPSLIMLSVIGFWQGYSFFIDKPPARKVYAILGGFLGITSIIISMLVAISVNDARFILIRIFSGQ